MLDIKVERDAVDRALYHATLVFDGIPARAKKLTLTADQASLIMTRAKRLQAHPIATRQRRTVAAIRKTKISPPDTLCEGTPCAENVAVPPLLRTGDNQRIGERQRLFEAAGIWIQHHACAEAKTGFTQFLTVIPRCTGQLCHRSALEYETISLQHRRVHKAGVFVEVIARLLLGRNRRCTF